MWSLHHVSDGCRHLHLWDFQQPGFLYFELLFHMWTQEMSCGKVCCKLKDGACMSSSSLSADWPVPPCSAPFSTCAPSLGWQVSSVEAAGRRRRQKHWRQPQFLGRMKHSLTSRVPFCVQELSKTSAPLLIVQWWTSAPAPSNITDRSSRSSMWVEISRQVGILSRCSIYSRYRCLATEPAGLISAQLHSTSCRLNEGHKKDVIYTF